MNIKILSLNVALLKGLFGLIDIQDNNEQRVELLINTILSYPIDQQPDIIALQEAFVYPQYINDKISTIYPYSYIDDNSGAYIVGVNSGLAIYSKYPIVDKVLYQYKYAKGDSLLARKGIMGIKIMVKRDDREKEAYIFNTHLQAGGNNNFFIKCLEFFKCNSKNLSTNQIRFLQLKEAADVIYKFVRTDLMPVFFVGDFNINNMDNTVFYDPESDGQIRVSGMINKIFPCSESFDMGKSYQKYSVYNGRKRIDYILNINYNKGYSYISNRFTADITDHRACIGIFEI